jgi:hypothetical protein
MRALEHIELDVKIHIISYYIIETPLFAANFLADLYLTSIH